MLLLFYFNFYIFIAIKRLLCNNVNGRYFISFFITEFWAISPPPALASYWQEDLQTSLAGKNVQYNAIFG
jgi:hypothetical protein